jgi:hypothetical protein
MKTSIDSISIAAKSYIERVCKKAINSYMYEHVSNGVMLDKW